MNLQTNQKKSRLSGDAHAKKMNTLKSNIMHSGS